MIFQWVAAPLGMLLALGINQLLIALDTEPRPYAVLDHPLLLVAPTLDPALPADHSAMAGAAAAGLWLAWWRLGAVASVARWQGQSVKPPAQASQEPSGGNVRQAVISSRRAIGSRDDPHPHRAARPRPTGPDPVLGHPRHRLDVTGHATDRHGSGRPRGAARR